MFEWMPLTLQVYLCAIVIGIALPLMIFWMVYRALAHFLAAIFHDALIVRFWSRQFLLVLMLAGLGPAIRYRPEEPVLHDSVAIVFSMADSLQEILSGVLLALFGLLLPLLFAFTILHAGKKQPAVAERPE